VADLNRAKEQEKRKKEKREREKKKRQMIVKLNPTD
jgi:hypothetical protein